MISTHEEKSKMKKKKQKQKTSKKVVKKIRSSISRPHQVKPPPTPPTPPLFLPPRRRTRQHPCVSRTTPPLAHAHRVSPDRLISRSISYPGGRFYVASSRCRRAV